MRKRIVGEARHLRGGDDEPFDAAWLTETIGSADVRQRADRLDQIAFAQRRFPAAAESPDAFIAVTNGDNTNAMSAQIAKMVFKVPHVVARLYDPIREETYQTLGLETVSPTNIGVAKIKEMITK